MKMENPSKSRDGMKIVMDKYNSQVQTTNIIKIKVKKITLAEYGTQHSHSFQHQLLRTREFVESVAI